ncbi:TerD family protein [Laceyella putida]|uniref:TerD family protein n=1 Tax=Laceyella putida TaxID=110101 RepID=A0ABW2RJ23_9BACL
MKNTIYLRRKHKVIIQAGQDHLPDAYLATSLKNLESLGYTFSIKLIEQVRTLSLDDFAGFYNQLIKDIMKMVGAHVHYQPMYPNFPQQVMEAEESALYINAIIHYLTHLFPKTEVKERLPLLDRVDLKVIDLGSDQEFNEMVKHLLSANTSISDTDKGDIEWAIAHSDDVQSLLPPEIPLKENVGFVVGVLLKYEKASMVPLSPYFKTATDVLRLETALSDGDVSLASNTKFKKFKRSERRLMLGLLEQCPHITEDMLRHKNRWIRLGEILHPGEYKNQFHKCREAFDVLRNNKAFKTFGSEVETALLHKNMSKAISLLKTRPGEFARRLDHLLRTVSDPQVVITPFAEVADRVSTPILLQVLAHFAHRHEYPDTRIFFPKGNVAKVMGIKNKLPALDREVCLSMIHICQATLTKRFSALPSLGNVFIDKRLKNFVVPFSLRSASKARRTLVRGSQLDIPEGNTIRFFTWWKEGKVNGIETGDVDIDLSAVIYDDKWWYKEHISFTNLKSAAYNACHSGDIVSAPDGACEFIDVDIPSALRHGARYVIMSLHSYSKHPFSALPECFAGWMIRQHPNSGEVFEPATVQEKVDLAADTQICIPAVIDLKERKVIWADLALKRHPDFYNTVEGNQRGMVLMGKAITTLIKPNLYDLFQLHGIARGVLVEEKRGADTVFAVQEGITPFDMEKIMAEFLV